MSNNNCLIYRHIRLDNNETFYIGIASNNKRPYLKRDRSQYWKNITNKTKYEVQILKSDLTWEDACELEKVLIDWYGRRDLNSGTLVNMTNGGEGATGAIVSKETRLKQSNIRSQKIINMNTLEVFKNVYCINTDININYFRAMINNNRTNTTPFIYLKDINNKNIKHNQTKIIELAGNKVINIKTGIIYKSVSQAARVNKLNQRTLHSYLTNERKNKTNLMYLKDYETQNNS